MVLTNSPSSPADACRGVLVQHGASGTALHPSGVAVHWNVVGPCPLFIAAYFIGLVLPAVQ